MSTKTSGQAGSLPAGFSEHEIRTGLSTAPASGRVEGQVAPLGIVLSRISLVGSALLSVVLFWVFFASSSVLALAQASDSLLDVVSAVILGVASTVGGTPRDAGHPMGHTRAEPLGALSVAALAILLGFEVGQSATLEIFDGGAAGATDLLLPVFLSKVAFKLLIWALARRGKTPVLAALTVDARNDLLVGAVALVGTLGVGAGFPRLDAWLSLPLAFYIMGSGVELARENVNRLMGMAPSEARQSALLGIVEAQPGVLAARDLKAHYLGSALDVEVTVEVLAELTVREGQGLARRVEQALLAEEEVVRAVVRVVPGGEKAR